MVIDFEGLDSSLDGGEDWTGEAEILETRNEGNVIVWALTDVEEAESGAEFYSAAFENLDGASEPSIREVMDAAMEYTCGRAMDSSASFYEMLQQMEQSCTVLNRPIEPGRAAGCIASGGCAMLLGDRSALEQIKGEGDTPAAVGGIALLPIYAADAGSVKLLWGVPAMVEDWKLKEMGCRLVEVYK